MRIPTERAVPDQKFFKIGEVSRILGVPPSAIRYWKETFASHIRPTRTSSFQHVFSRRDLSVLALIRYLVHFQGLSIRETKDRLSELLAQHGGDTDFIELEPPEGDRMHSRGFLAQLDQAKDELEKVLDMCAAEKARADVAEAKQARLLSERAALIATIKQAVIELAAEVEDE